MKTKDNKNLFRSKKENKRWKILRKSLTKFKKIYKKLKNKQSSMSKKEYNNNS